MYLSYHNLTSPTITRPPMDVQERTRPQVGEALGKPAQRLDLPDPPADALRICLVGVRNSGAGPRIREPAPGTRESARTAALMAGDRRQDRSVATAATLHSPATTPSPIELFAKP
jgi:hypothetical protein